MTNREFLQLAHNYDPVKHSVAGWYWSEKLDGMRAFWDGGITRGLSAWEVPWFNGNKKGGLIEEVVATGLWSRYGNVIRAPAEWLHKLPPVPLDGELYLGRQTFQSLVSITKRHEAGWHAWKAVRFHVFSSPPLTTVLSDGTVKNVNYFKVFNNFYKYFVEERHGTIHNVERQPVTQIGYLERFANEIVQPVVQTRLPLASDPAMVALDKALSSIVDNGGEGIMLQHPGAMWQPKRSQYLLKLKHMQDAEATVIGYTWGRGKHLRRMGALICEYKGQRFELSGMTDEERWIDHTEPVGLEGTECGPDVSSPKFPIGSQVTFRFRELTKDGVPKEARYYRKRID